MVIYNKAIRDKIPEIIKNSGNSSVVKNLSDEKFLVELEKKLKEEVEEYLENKSVEELTDIIEVINNNVSLLEELDKDIVFKFNLKKNKILLKFDSEQIGRVIFNLVKNSIESIQEKSLKNTEFTKIIDIEIINKSDYITVNITDNGTGFSIKNIKNIIKPYFTTKPKGSGLGLSIVNKIINDHNGSIKFSSNIDGAKVILTLPKN